MSSSSHDHAAPDPVTDVEHDNSWSANLEKPAYAEDPEAVVAGAKIAIEHTVPGNHVNLVSHGANGHPEGYLWEPLQAAYGDAIDLEYVEQCGCGGHVTRVQVLEE